MNSALSGADLGASLLWSSRSSACGTRGGGEEGGRGGGGVAVLGSPDYRQVIDLRRLWVRVRAAFGDGYCFILVFQYLRVGRARGGVVLDCATLYYIELALL